MALTKSIRVKAKTLSLNTDKTMGADLDHSTMLPVCCVQKKGSNTSRDISFSPQTCGGVPARMA